MAALLADAARLLRPTLGEQIEINATPVAGVPAALADPCHLMAAILNLAILARDAMPEGGKLGLDVEHVDREISAADSLMITVSASGHDIAAGYPGPVFADLGVVESFVRQSGGHLEVGRAVGRSTVRIYLPRAT